MNYSSAKKERTAFTLIELLVVIAIISLLVSILLPSLQRAKDLAKDVICKSNLKGIGASHQIWANDNDGYMMCWAMPLDYLGTGVELNSSRTPYAWSYILVDREYISATVERGNSLFNCPSRDENQILLDPTGIREWYYTDPDYGYNTILGTYVASGGYNYYFHQFSEVKNPSETIAFGDSKYGYILSASHSWAAGRPNPRHNDLSEANYSWVDGHAASRNADESDTAIFFVGSDEYYYWVPKKDGDPIDWLIAYFKIDW